MTGSAIVVMIIGMLIIWGGLAASIINAVRKGKQRKAA
ncbi:methionine/alanine import family NSS transporter small subunit [Planococcus salinus]|uniref:Methionine/alanine import family NSS transporter small subunit n=1 Tax=Planococcus salinus TaxID=1848460 RepID=A0A3M8P7Q1_9BACL|nr:methionine/alanine import family NSS transporter small subunit [Planococcus salinus]RNF39300.1 methionine/alanine import family NSS transporter small subunit [Planococcus salinus]